MRWRESSHLRPDYDCYSIMLFSIRNLLLHIIMLWDTNLLHTKEIFLAPLTRFGEGQASVSFCQV